jgi:hypothetical protein
LRCGGAATGVHSNLTFIPTSEIFSSDSAARPATLPALPLYLPITAPSLRAVLQSHIPRSQLRPVHARGTDSICARSHLPCPAAFAPASIPLVLHGALSGVGPRRSTPEERCACRARDISTRGWARGRGGWRSDSDSAANRIRAVRPPSPPSIPHGHRERERAHSRLQTRSSTLLPVLA